MNVPSLAQRFRSSPSSAWRLVAGGSNASLGGMATSITLGLLAYAALGPLAARWSLAAMFAALIVGAAVYALRATGPAPLVGLSSATTLILAGLIGSVARDPGLDLGRAADVEAAVAIGALTVSLSGLMQIALGAFGAGRLARQVPQPVLAGFMNGVALLIVLAQVPPLLGLPAGQGWRGMFTSPWHGAPLALGLATAAAAVWAVPRWPRVPGMLLLLLLGVLAVAAVPGMDALALLGQVTPMAPWPDALRPLLDGPGMALARRHAGGMVTTAAMLATVGGLESLLRARASESQQSQSSRAAGTLGPPASVDAIDHVGQADRELRTLGVANVISGLCGGLPLVLSLARSLLLHQADTRGRWPPLIGAGVLAAVYAFASPLLGRVPMAALAGVMLAVAVSIADRWTGTLLRHWRRLHRDRERPGGSADDAGRLDSAAARDDLRLGLAQVALVCVTTLGAGFGPAIVVGVVVSLAMFLRRMNRALLRSAGAAPPSRRLWGPAQEAVLTPQRRRIQRFVLEGALYFGNAEALAARALQLPADTRALVLDLRRLTMLDESGVVQLQSLATRLSRRGTALLLAGVAPQDAHAQRLRAYGGAGAGGWTLWPDADRAVEAAEQLLLADAGVPALAATMGADAHPFLSTLTAAQRARVIAALDLVRLPAGRTLFREGDAGDRMFLVLEGSVSIVRHATAAAVPRAPAAPSNQRYGSLSPGTIFGEIALLDGAGRSADAVADTDCHLAALTREALARLTADDPAIGDALMRRMALHMADRLRRAGDAWQNEAA